ncbi:MAG: 1-deoxy-D-xylulose-5-phosphate synthase [Actinomycetota bacterium]|nr:1-deoxy-D-xylulose-5-phosphate synthase [Actinomycetota bacterium]MDA8293677.1 1-deoxy-D-xylulose-5-phosphate synthase [Actinomycetota bacterium]
MILDHIDSPADLRSLSLDELEQLAAEIRTFVVESVTATGGHLGSNLGVVELTLALHRTFESPRDVLLWDTGHQAYVHKLVTGRRKGFAQLRQAGGLSGYPNRGESEHDWVENSHASTILSYAHGLANAFALQGSDRRVVAVVGDGALTGGMAYEALNNLGHSGARVLVVLNDNGRSYAPTVSRLSVSLTHLRLNPAYVQARQRIRQLIRELPAVGGLAYSGVHGFTSALREVVTPHTFFEALGIRYAGPIDGHDLVELEIALANATEWDGPIAVHVVTQKGRGYAPAEEDDVQRLHDVKVATPIITDPTSRGSRVAEPTVTARDALAPDAAAIPPATFTDAFTRALVRHAEADPRIVAITAAMPGPTGLLPFQDRFPDRFVDVGIAEQHAVTAAAGMAMAGIRPVVAVYSTFFTRAFDQANLDVGLHGAPVVFVLDRAGITGDDGPSHHGVLDLALTLAIPGMTVFAPSSAAEVEVMLAEALALEGPSAIRFPKTPAPPPVGGVCGSGLAARKLRQGDGTVCLLAVGKLVTAAMDAAELLAADGIDATVWDPRVISPPDDAMLRDARAHHQVVTVEDGVRLGGAGMFLADAMGAIESSEPVPPVTVLGTPRRFITQDKPDRILASLGLDAVGIAASVRHSVAARLVD